MARKTDSSTKPAAAAKATAPAKPVAKPAAKKPAAQKPKAAARKPAFTQEDVAVRAYFISEKRRTEGLPGDEHQDWLEAERQLAAETKSSGKSRKG